MTAHLGSKRSGAKRKSIEIQTVKESPNLDDRSYDLLGERLFSKMESPPVIGKNILRSPNKTNRGLRGGKINRIANQTNL
jgi:hypothetical protein